MTCASQNPVVLAVTGGIACGKSETGRILEAMGFTVCDADHIAHDLMKKGMPVYRDIVAHFGSCILDGDDEIARAALGNLVFEHPEQLEVLNRLVHPAVRTRMTDWIESMRRSKRNAAALVPLLFESGMDALGWDAVLCISSDEERVMDRLDERRLEREEAIQRIGAQMPLVEKEARTGYVIRNNGSLEELEQSTRETVRRITTEGVL